MKKKVQEFMKDYSIVSHAAIMILCLIIVVEFTLFCIKNPMVIIYVVVAVGGLSFGCLFLRIFWDFADVFYKSITGEE